MKAIRMFGKLLQLLALLSAPAALRAQSAVTLPGLPDPPASGPALCRGRFLTPEQGKILLDHTLKTCTTREQWETRAAMLRRQILRGINLDPLPTRTPLNPIVRNRREHDGYTIENIAFEPIPGYWATGNLYRPSGAGPFPAVLCLHGHTKQIEGEDHPLKAPRSEPWMQQIGGGLAKMGAVALTLDMAGFGESTRQIPINEHATSFTMTLQAWTNMRALDFLSSLEFVDAERLAVTGVSGGGTQTFLLAALDPRIKVSAPVVMVSSWFFGGCPCESGLPIHRSVEHFTNNAEIAALAAPRPMLVVSDGKDWTQHVPELEFPFIQKIYGLHDATDKVENVHLPDEGHDYGPSKREAMFRFMAKHLNLNLAPLLDASGKIDESNIKIESPEQTLVLSRQSSLPVNALQGMNAIKRALQTDESH